MYFRLFIKSFDNGTGTGDGDGSSNSNNNNNDKKFTQEDVNRLLAEDKKKNKARNDQLVAELEELRKNTKLTTEQKDALEERITELNNQYKTKEELARDQYEKEKKKYANELKELQDREANWKNRYSLTVIERDISRYANEHGAFSVEQMTGFLKPITEMKEVIIDGKGTGEYTPIVHYQDIDKNNKPIILELSVNEAIKRMKESPDRFGNMFKGEFVPGVGGSTRRSSGSNQLTFDPNMTQDEYRKFRKENKK